MYALFEEAGKYLGGRVLSEAEASAQVELDTGKRLKVKSANIVLRFEKPSPADLIAEARARAAEQGRVAMAALDELAPSVYRESLAALIDDQLRREV